MPTDTLTAILNQDAGPKDNGQATYLEAVALALDHEMQRDPDTFIIGEDVGQFGGAFKVTKGFLDKYGPRRVVDTPIAETGFTGLAAGAALVGLRPIVEFQFADFISCAFDPIINVLARHHWRTGDAMPVTMRMHGHAEHDPADYVPKEMFDEWAAKDPVELFEKRLVSAGVIDDATAQQYRADARQAAIDARKRALADPMPDPSNIEEGVYAD